MTLSPTSVAIVVYCPTCDYFLKTAVQAVEGTHGCAQCEGTMEVYVAQEFALVRRPQGLMG